MPPSRRPWRRLGRTCWVAPGADETRVQAACRLLMPVWRLCGSASCRHRSWCGSDIARAPRYRVTYRGPRRGSRRASRSGLPPAAPSLHGKLQ